MFTASNNYCLKRFIECTGIKAIRSTNTRINSTIEYFTFSFRCSTMFLDNSNQKSTCILGISRILFYSLDLIFLHYITHIRPALYSLGLINIFYQLRNHYRQQNSQNYNNHNHFHQSKALFIVKSLSFVHCYTPSEIPLLYSIIETFWRFVKKDREFYLKEKIRNPFRLFSVRHKQKIV